MSSTAREKEVFITTRYDEHRNVVHTYKGIDFFEFYSGNFINNEMVSTYQVIKTRNSFNSLEAITQYIDAIEQNNPMEFMRIQIEAELRKLKQQK